MTEVWIVEGSTGEYSDSHDWAVKAYRERAKAEAHVEALETWLRENSVSMGQEAALLDYRSRRELKTPLDPNFACDYTGVRYYTYAVLFEE